MIRRVDEKDAKTLAALIRQVESESSFMLYGPGERELIEETQRRMIRRLVQPGKINIARTL